MQSQSSLQRWLVENNLNSFKILVLFILHGRPLGGLSLRLSRISQKVHQNIVTVVFQIEKSALHVCEVSFVIWIGFLFKFKGIYSMSSKIESVHSKLTNSLWVRLGMSGISRKTVTDDMKVWKGNFNQSNKWKVGRPLFAENDWRFGKGEPTWERDFTDCWSDIREIMHYYVFTRTTEDAQAIKIPLLYSN